MRHLLFACLLAFSIVAVLADEIDFTRARDLMQRKRAGETLTADEESYLQRAKQERQKRHGSNQGGNPGKPTLGIKPLSEMAATDKYKGEDGGLYGGGRNTPPVALAEAAQRAVAKVKPVAGKVALISIGMSNTTQEFSKFMELARGDADRSPALTIVDGAQGGQDAAAWANGAQPWDVLDQRLKAAGVTADQVQVAWIKQALKGPARLGEFPKHAKQLESDIATIVARLKKRFPNLCLVYVSSRIYAGYASTPLNPEPYAFESAFAVRWAIRDQKAGEPVLLWGPYLWGDGTTARNADHLVWNQEDLRSDGTHPSDSGREKVAGMLLQFFKTDPYAKPWFVKH